MLDPQLAETLRSVLAPALGGATLLMLLWRPWRRDADSGERPAPNPWAVGLSLASAFAASWFIAQGYHGLWPTDTSRRVFWAPVIGLVVAATLAAPRWRVALKPAVVLLGALALTWFLTAHRRQPGRWEGAEIALWTSAWTMALGVGWLGLMWTCRRRPGPALPLTLSLAATALALVVVRAGVASLGQMGGLISAWLGLVFLLALWNRSFTLRGAGAHALAASVAALLVLGYTTAPNPRPHIGLGLAALLPLVGVPGALLSPSATGRSAIARLLIDAGTLALVGGAGVALAQPPSSGAGEDGLDDLYGAAHHAPHRAAARLGPDNLVSVGIGRLRASEFVPHR